MLLVKECGANKIARGWAPINPGALWWVGPLPGIVDELAKP